MYSKNVMYSKNNRKGFALILSVIFAGFIFLLLVSLLSLTQESSRASILQKKILLSDKTELFTVKVALGQLQKSLGSDLNVSARAPILSEFDESKEHLVGTWVRRQPSDSLTFFRWLSSDINSTARDFAELPVVEGANGNVVFNEGLSNEVFLNVQKSNAFNREFEYAFFIDDEGLKGKVLDERQVSNATSNFFTLREAFSGSQVSSLDLLPLNSDRIFLSTDFYLENNNLGGPIKSTFTENYTIHSKSLLTSSKSGGFKKDLTFFFNMATGTYPFELAKDPDGIYRISGYPNTIRAIDEKAPGWDKFKNFYRLKNNNGSLTPNSYSVDDYTIRPVLSGAQFYFRPGTRKETATKSHLRLYFECNVLLWNPYNKPIQLSNHSITLAFPDAGGVQPLSMQFGKAGQSGRPDPDDKEGALDPLNPPAVLPDLVHYSIKDFPNAKPFTIIETGESKHGLTFNLPNVSLAPGKTTVFSIPRQENLSAITEYNPSAPLTLVRGYDPSMYASSFIEVELPDDFFNNYPLFRFHKSGNINISGYLNDNNQFTTFELITKMNNYLQKVNEVYIGQGDTWSITSHFLQGLTNFWIEREGNIGLNKREQLNATTGFALIGAGDDNRAVRSPRWLANYNPSAAIQSINDTNFSLTSASNAKNNPSYAGFYDSRTPTTQILSSLRNAYLNFDDVGDRPVRGSLQNLVNVLYEVPQNNRELFNIAQFQHVDVSRYSYNPTYLLGNSLPHKYISSLNTVVLDATQDPINFSRFIDHAYLLNDFFWDDYYFSTIVSSSVANNRLLTNKKSGFQDWKEPALAQWLDGGFNINSTSVEAWKHLLLHGKGVSYNALSQTYSFDEESLSTAFARMKEPPNSGGVLFSGYLELTESQVDELANSIVAEIKQRGPFKSLAEFINRDLQTNGSTGVKGVIASAIDRSNSINNYSGSAFHQVNSADVSSITEYNWHASIGNDNAYNNGWLTQADVLSKIGDVITARSDTFVMHIHSKVKDQKGRLLKVLVQRTHQYIDNDQSAETPFSSLNAVNQRFGRKFFILGIIP